MMLGESCLLQHKLLVGILQLGECRKEKKEVLMSRCKVWRLKEPEIRQAYETKVQEKLAGTINGTVEEPWSGLKNCLLDVADEVCGRTRGGKRQHVH